MRACLTVAFVLMLLPATASAVTTQDIVSLTKAGVSEQVILALIERDNTIFTIAADQLVTLKNVGVSEAVLLAMLRSGRQEPPPAVAPVLRGASMQVEESEPNVVIVGHGPDRPNTGASSNYDGGVTFAVPYFVPVPYAVPARALRSRRPVRESTVPGTPFDVAPLRSPSPVLRTSAPGASGIFFTTPARGIFFDR